MADGRFHLPQRTPEPRSDLIDAVDIGVDRAVEHTRRRPRQHIGFERRQLPAFAKVLNRWISSHKSGGFVQEFRFDFGTASGAQRRKLAHLGPSGELYQAGRGRTAARNRYRVSDGGTQSRCGEVGFDRIGGVQAD